MPSAIEETRIPGDKTEPSLILRFLPGAAAYFAGIFGGPLGAGAAALLTSQLAEYAKDLPSFAVTSSKHGFKIDPETLANAMHEEFMSALSKFVQWYRDLVQEGNLFFFFFFGLEQFHSYGSSCQANY